MQFLIGLSGKARCGKDTIADYLVAAHGFRRYALADHLKWLANTYFGISADDLWVNKTRESRILLQHLGDFLRKEVREDYFIEKLTSKIVADYAQLGANERRDFKCVITDVRFINELSMFDREYRGFLTLQTPEAVESDSILSIGSIFRKSVAVRVIRDTSELVNIDPSMPREAMTHISEVELDAFDNWKYMILNNSTVEVLYEKAEEMLRDIVGGMHD